MPGRTGPERVLIAIRHAPMRRLTGRVLAQGCPPWTIEELQDEELLVDAMRRVAPDVLVVDTGDFPACCHSALTTFPPDRVIVIGPEPEAAYRLAALSEGAGAWVARDRIAEDAAAVLRALLRALQAGEAASGTKVPRFDAVRT